MEYHGKSKSIFAHLYRATYIGRLPNNLCEYFWKLVTALLLLPCTWITYIRPFQRFLDVDITGFSTRIATGVLQQGLLTLFWGIGMYALQGVGLPTWVRVSLALPFTLVLGFLFLLAIAAVCISIDKSQDLYRDRVGKKVPKEKSPNLLWAYVKARKAKYCPRIVWDDEPPHSNGQEGY